VFVHENLESLGHAGRKFAPFLDCLECALRDPGFEQRLRKNVRGCNRVLNGQIDADTADRRHGMGGITDAQKTGPRPVPEPVDGDRQQLDIVP